jgi:hypothetical protein
VQLQKGSLLLPALYFHLKSEFFVLNLVPKGVCALSVYWTNMTCAHKPAKILIVDTTPSEKERASKCKGLLGNYKSEIVVSSWQRRKSVYACISHNCWIHSFSGKKCGRGETARAQKIDRVWRRPTKEGNDDVCLPL